MSTTTAAPNGVEHSLFVYEAWISTVSLAIASFVATMSIFGNSLVMIAFYLERPLRQAPNYLIVALAICDLWFGITSANAFPLQNVTGLWPLGWTACQIWYITDWTLTVVTQAMAFYIAADRFKSIQSPTVYRHWRTRRKVLTLIILTFVLASGALCLLYKYATEDTAPDFTVNKPICDLRLDPTASYILQVVLFWIPLSLMCHMYYYMFSKASEINKRVIKRGWRMKPMARRLVVNKRYKLEPSSQFQSNKSIVSMPRDINQSGMDYFCAGEHHRVNCKQLDSKSEAGTVVVGDIAASKPPSDIYVQNTHQRATRNELAFLSNENSKCLADIAECVDSSRAKDSNGDYYTHIRSRSNDVVTLQEIGFDASSEQELYFNTKSLVADLNNSGSFHNLNGSTQYNLTNRVNFPPGERVKSFETNAEFNDDRTNPTSLTVSTRPTIHLEVPASPLPGSPYPDPLSPKILGDPEPLSLAVIRTRKALRTISCILGLFLVCYLPTYAVYIIRSIPGLIIPGYLTDVLFYLAYVNSALNPLVYAYANPLFQESFRRILRWDFTKNKSHASRT